ncbi:hypothetical protein [Bacillus pseudomycoides]|nr:hypothetical protein [Bacillus pseudomycoides]
MNAWLFAGCMFLVAVSLNILLLFSQRIIKKVRNKKYKSQNEFAD